MKRFRTALAAAEELPESEWPERPAGKRRKRDRDFERKVDALINAREQAAAKLDIEGSLIAPRAVLESLAAGDAKPADVLLKWQRECLGMDGLSAFRHLPLEFPVGSAGSSVSPDSTPLPTPTSRSFSTARPAA